MVIYILIDYILIKGNLSSYPRKFRMDPKRMSSIVNQVKELMKKELEENPHLCDKEYEQAFVKHYLSLIDTMKISSTNSKGKPRV